MSLIHLFILATCIFVKCPLCARAFPVALVVKNPPASAEDIRDTGSIPGSRRSPGEGKGYPLQYSGLENSTDWIVHGVTKELDTTEAAWPDPHGPTPKSTPVRRVPL